jgi:hypothetical protein
VTSSSVHESFGEIVDRIADVDTWSPDDFGVWQNGCLGHVGCGANQQGDRKNALQSHQKEDHLALSDEECEWKGIRTRKHKVAVP